MSTTSLAIFKQLFLKNLKDIKDIFTNITAFVEDKDKAIAEFLSIEYPELIWLIRVLHFKYDKQFSPHLHTQQQTVENIAKSITLTVDETGTLDYGQKNQNNLVFNTLETHLLAPQDTILQDSPTHDDIISLDGSNPNMDFIYQSASTFYDIAQQLASFSTNNDEINVVTPHYSCEDTTDDTTKNPEKRTRLLPNNNGTAQTT